MLTISDKYKIMKISNENFNNCYINKKKNNNNDNDNDKIDNVVKYNKIKYYDNTYFKKNKYNFEKYNIINANKLKPTHKGGGKIIQPGGGYKGN
tara:strand:- start:1601 stop:1882 length:282 start_codon:yes stop_codon:yes gene_type:complete